MENTVYTKGFINDDGCVEIPGVFLEDGAEVELAIKVISGKFEIAMFPSEDDENETKTDRFCPKIRSPPYSKGRNFRKSWIYRDFCGIVRLKNKRKGA